MPRSLSVLPAVLALALVVVQAASAQAADEQAAAACGQTFDACVARCERSYADDAAASAGCQASCAADRAVCEAKAGYDSAKPWVADQFRKMQRFFDGFTEQGEGGAPATPPLPPSAEPPPHGAEPGEVVPPSEYEDT
ncbi:hypothetical protein [Caenispirillum bisanense]|uniref:hypothetical protein n=1 Tax=Caenispirillum bisanense TaxID=414052 RepID=UPI0031E163C6